MIQVTIDKKTIEVEPGTPIVAAAHGTAGLADHCAPSKGEQLIYWAQEFAFELEIVGRVRENEVDALVRQLAELLDAIAEQADALVGDEVAPQVVAAALGTPRSRRGWRASTCARAGSPAGPGNARRWRPSPAAAGCSRRGSPPCRPSSRSRSR